MRADFVPRTLRVTLGLAIGLLVLVGEVLPRVVLVSVLDPLAPLSASWPLTSEGAPPAGPRLRLVWEGLRPGLGGQGILVLGLWADSRGLGEISGLLADTLVLRAR